jgi:glycosyltransferase involved in cell wall biosynthesis
MSKIKSESIWVITGDASKEAAGPLPALRSFSKYCFEKKINLVVLATIGQKETQGTSIRNTDVRWMLSRRIGPLNLHFAPSMMLCAWRQWSEQRPSSLVLDGVWYTVGAVIATIASMLGVRVYIIPHGSLNSRAMKINAIRKRVLTLLLRPLFKRAVAFMALSPFEKGEILKVSPKGIVLQASNAINVVGGWDGMNGPILFLGRIDPIKNLEFIIDAYSSARQRGCLRPLQIAGPGNLQYIETLRQRCLTLGISDSVSFLGPLYGEKKFEVMKKSRIFLMASHSEAQPYALLEALSVGVPSVITENCKLWFTNPSVTVVSENSIKDYSNAICALDGMNNTEFAYLSKLAVQLISEYYREEIVWTHRIECLQALSSTEKS